MTIILTRLQRKVVIGAIERKRSNSAVNTIMWIFIYFGFVIVNLGGFVIALYFLMAFHQTTQIEIEVDTSKIVETTSDKFLSIALDTSIVRKGWGKFELDSPAVIKMVSALSPSYLRFGGTASDCLIFDSGSKESSKIKYPVDGETFLSGDEDFEAFKCNFTMSENDWLKINKFAKVAGLDLIFDLNVLLRNGKGWDPNNAMKLIKLTHEHRYPVSWQLGNEPNSFNHVFNKEVSGTQLAKDFTKLRGILDKMQGTNVKLVGPDITNPRPPELEAIKYLIDFLKEIKAQGRKRVIDAVTWHHYYLNGRNSTLKDYINPSNFKQFHMQAQLVKNTVSLISPGTPVWITETSDAYGGGTPNITDRFVGSFMWLEKLGTAATFGVQVVTRQSIYGGYYGLIDEDLNPTPDFWVSYLYKKLVGPRVLSLSLRDRKPCNSKRLDNLKFYAHCAPHAQPFIDGGAVTIFGYNMGSQTETVALDYDLELAEGVRIYILTGENGLQSRNTLLNGYRLELKMDGRVPHIIPETQKSKVLTIPPFAIVFWQIYGIAYPICD